MAQGRDSIRGWLVLLACAVVLVFAVVIDRRSASRDEAAAAEPHVPKAETPPAAPRAEAEPAVSDAREAEASAVVPSVAAPSPVANAAEEAARDASWREAREATIRVQQRLRAEQQARKAAEQQAAKNERCVNGQRMKRVENGWVEAGDC